MILHLIGNDPKFPKMIREKYESALPGQNTYVIIKNRECEEGRGGDGFYYVSNCEDLMSVVARSKEIEAVVINGLLLRLFPYLRAIPSSVPWVYYLWGAEAYGNILISIDSLYSPKTSRWLFSRWGRIKFIFKFLNPFYWLRALRVSCVTRNIGIAIFPIEEELKFFVSKRLLKTTVKIVYGSVGAGVDFSAPYFRPRSLGPNILVGNSADPANNHIDVFRWLLDSGINFEGRKIIVPLSYGGSPKYCQVVKDYGRDYFGEQFVPIEDFMPYDEYIETMHSCGTVIMGHLRQQGAGNITAALAIGATVYLRTDSRLAIGLERMGFYLKKYALGNTLEDPENERLTAEQVCINKTQAQIYFSKEKSRQTVLELVSWMRSERKVH